MLTGESVTEFWDQVSLPGPSGCMPWRGRLNADGYGVFGPQIASRVACWMAYGPPTFGPYTYETHAAHECRNRHCVAPEHLSWKTPKGNGADKIRDGSQAGQKHPHAKMTDGQVREILTRLSEPDRLLAIEFGVSRGTINDIRNGKRWKHISR